QPEPELRLLLEQHQILEQPRPRLAAVGTALAHALMAVLVVFMPAGTGTYRAPDITVNFDQATPLIAPPPSELTQKDPNTRNPSDEVNLEGLVQPPSLPDPPAVERPASARPLPQAPKPTA